MDYFSSLNASTLDPDTPTLFEIFSSKELDDLIGPCIRYILTFYAQRHPRYLLRVATKFDEIFAVLKLIVEYHHLKNWNSTFTDKFYGLKKTRVLNENLTLLKARQQQVGGSEEAVNLVEKTKRLSKYQIYGSLFIAVVWPYLKEKMDIKYEQLKARSLVRNMDLEYKRIMEPESVSGESEDQQYQRPKISRKEKFYFLKDYWFYKLYPIVNSGHAAISLMFFLFYMFSKTSAHSLSDWILGVKYSRMSNFDYMLADERENQGKILPPLTGNNDEDQDDDTPLIGKVINRLFLDPKRIFSLDNIKKYPLAALSYALPTSMFLLKFLEWWSSSDFAQKLVSKTGRSAILDGNLPIPKKHQESLETVKEEDKDEQEDEKRIGFGDEKIQEVSKETKTQLKRNSILCPLCAEPITNPTAIETGVVFCYTCIYKHLESCDEETGGYCPVTGTRLLQCKYNPELEQWDIGGLRRLVV